RSATTPCSAPFERWNRALSTAGCIARTAKSSVGVNMEGQEVNQSSASVKHDMSTATLKAPTVDDLIDLPQQDVFGRTGEANRWCVRRAIHRDNDLRSHREARRFALPG